MGAHILSIFGIFRYCCQDCGFRFRDLRRSLSHLPHRLTVRAKPSLIPNEVRIAGLNKCVEKVTDEIRRVASGEEPGSPVIEVQDHVSDRSPLLIEEIRPLRPITLVIQVLRTKGLQTQERGAIWSKLQDRVQSPCWSSVQSQVPNEVPGAVWSRVQSLVPPRIRH